MSAGHRATDEAEVTSAICFAGDTQRRAFMFTMENNSPLFMQTF